MRSVDLENDKISIPYLLCLCVLNALISKYTVTCFRRLPILDRDRHGGGALLIFKDSLRVTRRSDLDCHDIEAFWVEVQLKDLEGLSLLHVFTFHLADSSVYSVYLMKYWKVLREQTGYCFW